MPEPLLCRICQKRRARRYCPAVSGDICSICCGTEREVSLTCPLSCEYLREAHKHEKPIELAASGFSNSDILINEQFLREHEELLVFLVFSLVQAALRTSGANDSDLITALEALIQTYRTRESGLYYETRPENAVALAIQRSFSDSLVDYEKLLREREHRSGPKNSDMLKVLVFLHRMGQTNQNGKPRCRMFLDLLAQMTPESERVPEAASRIII